MYNICILIVVVKLAFQFSLVDAQGCTKPGWFGHRCQYKCHCENDKCNFTTGQCTDNTKCVKGWFGLGCQYQDLTRAPSTTIIIIGLRKSNKWIFDTKDSTCNQDSNLQSVVVAWNITYPFSWLRLTVKDIAYPGNFKVSFKESVNNLTEINCNNQRIFVIDAKTVDISCQMTVDVMQIIIGGQSVTSLCSLYISGGRNVAVKQTAVQSSTYYNSVQAQASNAVDGNTNSSFQENTCTHTEVVDSYPNWKVTFNQTHAINRIVLYNRFDGEEKCCPERLVNFGLQTFNASYKSIFSFRDKGMDPMLIYTVIVPFNQRNIPIIGIRVDSSAHILSLCEVQAFEECSYGKWGLECNSACNTNCSTSCDVENGLCPVCIGSSNPPLCNEECGSKKWGLNCSQNCSTNCYNQSCNSQTGACDKGCNGYSNAPVCTAECESRKWGLNCSQNCSKNCFKKSCNSRTGVCDKGCNGYSDAPVCTKHCGSGNWGLNCSQNCNTNCYNQSCNSRTGVCNKGCNGYSNAPGCTTECESRKWGLNCSQNCSTNCYNQSCNSRTGVCDKGCNGYSNAPGCTTACPLTSWGFNCASNCSKNCTESSCDKITGYCDQGCNGFTNPPICNNECSFTKWGLNCNNSCNGSCYNLLCERQTGICSQGCNGYSDPPNCTTECTPGTWGRDCESLCSSNCSNTSCDRKSGICDRGCNGCDNFPDCNKRCRDGAYGINCSKTCSSNCTNSTCDSLLGFCVSCINYHKGNFCEVITEQRNEDTTLGVIVGSIIVFIVPCALIFSGVILWRRHAAFKKYKHNPEGRGEIRLSQFGQMNFNKIENNYSESNHQDNNKGLTRTDEIYGNEGLYNNVQITSLIAVKDLNTFMQSHNKHFFEQQFMSIPAPQNVSTEIGKNASNRHKNRYKNICAYDHSRVHLEINTSKNEEDYINACFIEGFNKDEKFIASQGPNKIILNDFVRMLWEQQVDKVVMLTNLIEEGTVKCEQYWLDDRSVQFGEIQVRMITIETFADCVIRFLELSKPREAVAAQTFTHFHFTSWPDKGVPVSPWGLVDFEQRVFAHPTSRPIVVHCSAGVGRTGTFIALRNVLREAEQTGHVDFFKTVVKLRQDRILMIQTMEQYWFLHKAAQVATVCIGTAVKSNDIAGRIKSLEEKSLARKTKIEAEFTAVSTVIDDLKEDFDKAEDLSGEVGNVYQNSEAITDVIKNRFSNIIPKQIYRPFLDCETNDMSDYINAVFLPGFKKQSQHLLTQLPKPTTVVDFWRLVTQYNVSLIVAFEVHTMVTDKTFGNYSPTAANQELMCSPYVIKSKTMNKAALWEEQLLTVETEKLKSLVSVSSINNETQTVIHLKCLFTELDPGKLLSFLRQIRSYNAQAQGRILYTCSNGAKYSGLACVLFLLLDRMEHDSYLTVPLVVGTVKTIRKEVIPNLDQYSVLYDVLGRHSDNSVTYDNFGNVSHNEAAVEDSSINEDQDGNLYANY